MKESQKLPHTKTIVHPCYPNITYKLDDSHILNTVFPGCDIKGSENSFLENYKLIGVFDEQKCKTLLTKIMYNYAGGASADVYPVNDWAKFWKGLIGGNKHSVRSIDLIGFVDWRQRSLLTNINLGSIHSSLVSVLVSFR